MTTDLDQATEIIEALDFEPACSATFIVTGSEERHPCENTAEWAIVLRHHCLDKLVCVLHCNWHYKYAKQDGTSWYCSKCKSQDTTLNSRIVRTERLRMSPN